MKAFMPAVLIERKIYLIRGLKVMLSTDMAELYGVEPKVLVQAVKRNSERFPEDFMFQLTVEEFENLKSQFVTSSWGGIRRAAPYAFTEQGIIMAASILSSPRAVHASGESRSERIYCGCLYEPSFAAGSFNLTRLLRQDSSRGKGENNRFGSSH